MTPLTLHDRSIRNKRMRACSSGGQRCVQCFPSVHCRLLFLVSMLHVPLILLYCFLCTRTTPLPYPLNVVPFSLSLLFYCLI